jgi:hypothetical protein
MRRARQGQWVGKEHPRGMLGKKHTEATLKKMAAGMAAANIIRKAAGTGPWSEENRRKVSERTIRLRAERPDTFGAYSRAASGYRDDLPGIFFRSSWEPNYARYLNLLVKLGLVVEWAYEPETFWFSEIKRGVRSYKPDFRVLYKNASAPVYVEVKGWMDSKSKTKISRFRKYYPQHTLEIVGKREYLTIKNKWRASLPLWEGR